MPEKRAEKHENLHENCELLLSDFHQHYNVPTNFTKTPQNQILPTASTVSRAISFVHEDRGTPLRNRQNCEHGLRQRAASNCEINGPNSELAKETFNLYEPCVPYIGRA